MKFVNKLQQEKPLFWMVKFLITVCLILLLANFALVATIFTILPLKEVKPYLVQVSPKSEQVVAIEPIEQSSKGLTLLMEQLARQYVEMRETIDLQTENIRWQKMEFFESEDVNTDFHNLMRSDNKESPLLKFNERGAKRYVKIFSSNNLGPTAPNVYQVEWIAIDFDTKRNIEINRRVFVSTITTELNHSAVKEENKLINPIGFTVINYGTSLKTTGEDSETK